MCVITTDTSHYHRLVGKRVVFLNNFWGKHKKRKQKKKKKKRKATTLEQDIKHE